MGDNQGYWSRRETLSLVSGFAGSWLIGSCTDQPALQTASSSTEDAKFSQSASPQDTLPQNLSETSEETSVTDLPAPMAAIFEASPDPDVVLTALMPAVVEALQCDRSFLFIRDPQRQRTRITHGYSRSAQWPTLVQSGWSQESQDLNAKDPLTLSAYQSPEAHFIEDIETAAPGTLDLGLERSFFEHRALVHAPIYQNDMFYGILEPCVFDRPRVWTERDRTLIAALQQVLGSWIVRYLQQFVNP